MLVGDDVSAVDRFDVTTDDPGRIDDLTRSMFGAGVRVERHDGRPPSLRLAHMAVETFGVQQATWDAGGRCVVEPLDRFVCVRVRRGGYSLDQGRGRSPYVAGDAFMIDPLREVDAEIVGAELHSVSLDLSVLRGVAEQVAPRSRGRLDHSRARPITPGLARALDDVLTDTARMLAQDDLVASNELIRAGAIFRLAATACAAFDLVGPARSERSVPARAVRSATDFIDDHLAEPITVGDIAAAAGLSARGLNAAFRRVLDTSPYAWLQRARLHAVRRELLEADDLTTVSGSARRWGFHHLGRFADHYRAEFGELPSATLRR